MKMVIHPPVEDERLAKIQEVAGAMNVVNAKDQEAACAEIHDADAFFGKLTPLMLERAERLRWVQSPTASLEHYLFPELIEHPLQLTNMRGLFSDNIADQVMGYVLCFARNLHLYVRNQVERRWAPVGGESSRAGFATGPGVVNEIDRAHQHLPDATMGVVGLGAIGEEIARRANSFGMRVVAVDPLRTAAPEGVVSLWAPSELDELLATSDYVTIAAPQTPETEGWFGASQFRAMKRSAVLINIGRGAIVRLDDLDAALEQDEIGGAALDVFEIEPLPPEHSLWGRANVIITPHVAGYSPRIAERHLNVLLDNIARFVSNKPLNNVANKQKWF